MSNTMPKTKAPCLYCGKKYTKGGFTRHIKTCKERQAALKAEKSKQAIHHLRVEDAHSSLFWMDIEIASSQTLARLDHFLRDVWLECCGHMSLFEIAGITYSSYPMEDYGDKSMKSKLNRVLRPQMQFSHMYDFGTSTNLVLKVVGNRQGDLPKKPDDVRILGRNDLPPFICGKCEERPPTLICQECMWEDNFSFWCDRCVDDDDHEHDEEMLLPIVNSPRMGECGFTGARLT